MAVSNCDSQSEAMLRDKMFSMYSSSCPNESNCSLMGKLENECYVNDFFHFTDKEQKYQSEDCLSMISNEFDQCPELNDMQLTEEDGSFEMLNNDGKQYQSSYLKPETSRQGRRGSDAMRELSVTIINKINRKFYSMRVGEWLKIRIKINSKVPVYLLGKKYLFNNVNYANLMGKKEFMLDFTSKFWFTYRQNFKCLPCSKAMIMTIPEALRSSDCGWGCMVRSGQMMMAQALSIHFLGRNWRRTSTCQRDQAFYRQIIKWFGDTPKLTSPFSIHQILRISDYNPGDWFGPHSVCSALSKALNESPTIEPKLKYVKIYFAQERILFREEVNDLLNDVDNETDGNGCADQKHNSIIFLIPLFLGSGTYCSSVYLRIIGKWLQDPLCLGLIGGKPRHSIYMVGCQDKNIIYMDPHVLQDAVNVSKDKFPIETFHCVQPLVMPFRYLDPNCAVGFYCRNADEVASFLERIQDMSTVYIKSPRGWQEQPTIEVLPGYSEHQQNLVETI